MPDGMEQFVTLLQQFTKPSEKLQLQVKELRQELQMKESLVSTLKSSSPSAVLISECEKKLAKIQSRIAELQSNTEPNMEQNVKLAKELKLARGELQTESERFSEQQQILKSQIETLERQKKDVEQSLAQKTQELGALNSKFGEKESNLANALSQNIETSKALAHSKENVAAQIAIVTSLKEQIASLKASEAVVTEEHQNNIIQIQRKHKRESEDLNRLIEARTSENAQLNVLNQECKSALSFFNALRAKKRVDDARRVENEKQEALESAKGDALQGQLQIDLKKAREASRKAQEELNALVIVQRSAQQQEQKAQRRLTEIHDAKILELQTTIDANVLKLADLQREHDSKIRELSEQEGLKIKEKNININLRDQFSAKERDFIEQNERSARAIALKEAALSQSNQTVQELTLQLQETESQITQLKEVQSALESQVAALSSSDAAKSSEAAENVSKKQLEIDELTRELSEIKIEFEGRLDTLKSENNSLETSVNRLTESNRILNEGSERQKAKITECDEAKQAAEAQLAASKKENSKIKGEAASAAQQVASLTTIKDGALSERDVCTNALQTERQTVADKNATLEQKDSQLSDLNRQIGEKDAEIQENQRLKELDKDALAKAKRESDECRAEVKAKDTEITQHIATVDKKAELINELQQQKLALDEDVRVKTETLQRAQVNHKTQIKNYEQQIRECHANANRLVAQQRAKRRQIENRHGLKISTLKDQISKAEAEVKTLKGRLDTSVEKDQQIEILQAEILRLTTAIEAVETKKASDLGEAQSQHEADLALIRAENADFKNIISKKEQGVKDLEVQHSAYRLQTETQIRTIEQQIEATDADYKQCIAHKLAMVEERKLETTRSNSRIAALQAENEEQSVMCAQQLSIKQAELEVAEGETKKEQDTFKKALAGWAQIETEFDQENTDLKQSLKQQKNANEELTKKIAQFEDEIKKTIGDSDKSWQSRLQDLKTYECKWLCKGAEYFEGINLKICQHLKIYSYTKEYDSQQDADRVNLQKSFLEPFLAKNTTQLYYKTDDIGLAALMLPNLEKERWHIIEEKDYAAFLESNDFLHSFSSENINILLIPMGTSVGPYQNLVEPLPGEDSDYDIKQALGGGVQNSREQEHAFRYAHGVRTLALKVTEESHLIGKQLDQFYKNLRISIKMNEQLIKNQRELLEKYKTMYKEIVTQTAEKPGDLPDADDKIRRATNSELFTIWKERSELLARYQKTISILLSTVESAKSKKK